MWRNKKLFAWSVERKAPCGNTPEQVGDNLLIASRRACALWLSFLPFRLQPSCPEIIERDALRFDGFVPTPDHALRFVPVEFNSRVIVGQVEIYPIRREVGIEDVADTVLRQALSKERFPFCHGHFGKDVRFRSFLMSLLDCGSVFLTHAWTLSNGCLTRFVSDTCQTRMVKLRATTRPVIRLWVRSLIDRAHSFGLFIAASRIPFPGYLECLTDCSPRNAEEREQFGDRAITHQQEPTYLARRLQFFAVKTVQDCSRIVLRQCSNAIDDGVERVSHYPSIITQYCESANVGTVEGI